MEGNISVLKPFMRPKEYYCENNTFIVSLPSKFRRNEESEFHIGKDIFNRSDRYMEWSGNEALCRMKKKYCFNPSNLDDVNVKNSFFDPKVTNVFPPSNCSEITAQKNAVISLSSELPNISPSNLIKIGNSQFNWHMQTLNNWSGNQYSDSHGTTRNSSVSDQRVDRMLTHNENNSNVTNRYWDNSIMESPNEQCSGFSNPMPYKQKDVQSESKEHSISPSEKKENLQRLLKSMKPKLLQSALPFYNNEKQLIAVLKSKRAKFIIFADLNRHCRFLHRLPDQFPDGVHVVILFRPNYKFPVFANASLEQLIKSDCLYIHPDSNSVRKQSLHCLINLIRRADSDLPLDVTFIILSASNTMMNEMVQSMAYHGRRIHEFKQGFKFAELYCIFKNQTDKSTP